MSIKQPDVRHQLMLLKEQTRLTGGLHDAQVLQLKMWPLVAFDQALSSSFTWDPDKKVIVFMLDMPSGPKPILSWWKVRVRNVNDWVQALLGDEWMVEVKVNGKNGKTYRGTRKISGVSNSPVASG